MPLLRSLLGLTAVLLSTVVRADPTYSPVCGDVATATCPGEPFPGSSFTGVACTGVVNAWTGFQDKGTGFSIQACAAACAFQAIMRFTASGGLGYCECFDDISSGSFDGCANGFTAVYFHGAAAQVSGLSRRAQRALTRRVEERDASPCPAGRTACRIQVSDDGYECIDTMTELESCGGCLHGVLAVFPPPFSPAGRPLRMDNMAPLVFGPEQNEAAPAAVGFDCSDHSRFGPGLTCRDGACVPI